MRALACAVAAIVPACVLVPSGGEAGAISGWAVLPDPEAARVARHPLVVFARPVDGRAGADSDSDSDSDAVADSGTTTSASTATAPLPTIRLRSGSFEPSFLVLAAGQAVQFVNEDEIRHRVFSSSEPNAFDLRSLARGESRSARLAHPGPVRYYCSLHDDERGVVFVAPGCHFAVVEPTGRFELGGLAPGTWDVRTWHERLPPHRFRVEVRSGETSPLEIAIDGTLEGT